MRSTLLPASSAFSLGSRADAILLRAGLSIGPLVFALGVRLSGGRFLGFLESPSRIARVARLSLVGWGPHVGCHRGNCIGGDGKMANHRGSVGFDIRIHTLLAKKGQEG